MKKKTTFIFLCFFHLSTPYTSSPPPNSYSVVFRSAPVGRDLGGLLSVQELCLLCAVCPTDRDREALALSETSLEGPGGWKLFLMQQGVVVGENEEGIDIPAETFFSCKWGHCIC